MHIFRQSFKCTVVNRESLSNCVSGHLKLPSQSLKLTLKKEIILGISLKKN